MWGFLGIESNSSSNEVSEPSSSSSSPAIVSASSPSMEPTSTSLAPTKVSASGNALKWITTKESSSGTRSLVVHDITGVMRPILSNPCNVISIFGEARQGKSFLMNCLAGEMGIFKISNKKDPCTVGIDISNKWHNLQDFERGGAGAIGGVSKWSLTSSGVNGSNATQIKVGYVDAEGQGDRDINYDAKLVCPVLLVSKCVIFNWKNTLQVDHILNQLGIMQRAAKNVAEDISGSAEGGGGGSGGKKSPTKKFGHLHIVFRDWTAADGTRSSVYKALFQQETTSDGLTRNQIRKDILDAFESVTVWLFCAPTDKNDDLKKELDLRDTTSKFRSQVAELRGVLAEQLRTPTYIGGKNERALTGSDLMVLVSYVTESLNKGQVIQPQSAYINLLKVELEDKKNKLEDALRHEADKHTASLEKIEEVGKKEEGLMRLPTEGEFVVQITSIFDAMIAEYSKVVAQTVGLLTGEQLRAVDNDSMTKLETFKSSLLKQCISSYREFFTKCLLVARKQAEAKLEADVMAFEKSGNYFSVQDVDTQLEQLKQDVCKTMGFVKHAINDQVMAAVEQIGHILSLHKDRIYLSLRVRNDNSQKIMQKMVEEAVGKVDEAIKKIPSQHPNGYPIAVVDDVIGTMGRTELTAIEKRLAGGIDDSKQKTKSQSKTNVNPVDPAILTEAKTLYDDLVKPLRDRAVAAYEVNLEKQIKEAIDKECNSITTALTELTNNSKMIDETVVKTAVNNIEQKAILNVTKSLSPWQIPPDILDPFLDKIRSHVIEAVSSLPEKFNAARKQAEEKASALRIKKEEQRARRAKALEDTKHGASAVITNSLSAVASLGSSLASAGAGVGTYLKDAVTAARKPKKFTPPSQSTQSKKNTEQSITIWKTVANKAARLAQEEEDRKMYAEQHSRFLAKKEEAKLRENSPQHIFLRLAASDDKKNTSEKMRDMLRLDLTLVNTRDEIGNTALHLAASHGHMDICELLVRHSADIDSINEQGNTPLHCACLFNRLQIIEFLLKEGASISILNMKNRKALELLEVDNEERSRLEAMASSPIKILKVPEGVGSSIFCIANPLGLW